MPALLQNIIGQTAQKSAAPPTQNGGPTPPTGPLPASLQAGNTPSGIMQWLSGMLGGGNPQQQQNNTEVGKAVQHQMDVQAAQSKAEADAIRAHQRSLKQSMKSIAPAPLPGTPGSGQTPPTQPTIANNGQ